MRPPYKTNGRVRYIPGPVYHMPTPGYEGIVLEARAGAEEETGLLIKDIVGLVDQLGYNIHKLVVSDHQEDTLVIFLVVKRRSSGRDRDTLVSMLKRLPRIDAVRPSQKHTSVLYSEDMFPPLFLGERGVMMSMVSLEGLVVKSRDIMGDHVANLFLDRLGTFIGKKYYEGYSSLALGWNRQDTIHSFLRMLLSLTGWAILEDYKVEPRGITIVLRNLWETQLMQDHDLKEPPHLTQAIIRSLFEEITKAPVQVKTKIINQRDGTLTVFQIKPQHRHAGTIKK